MDDHEADPRTHALRPNVQQVVRDRQGQEELLDTEHEGQKSPMTSNQPTDLMSHNKHVQAASHEDNNQDSKQGRDHDGTLTEISTSLLVDPEMRHLYEDEGIQQLAESFLLEAEAVKKMEQDGTFETRPYKQIPGVQFSMMEAFDDNPDLLILLVAHLNLPDIISLYSIDKRFHYHFNTNIVAYIRTVLKRLAPDSEDIFPWHHYKELCMKDPLPRLQSQWEGREHSAQNELQPRRDVPSLRYLQMVVYREGVTKDILIQLALQGLRCPPHTSDAIKRMWFLLDLPLNAYRIALIRTPDYISNDTLVRLTCFFMKLDMLFTDPAGLVFCPGHENTRLLPAEFQGASFVGVELREYMLAEKSLTPLWRVTHGWAPDPALPQIPITRLDMLRLYVRHKWAMPADVTGAMRDMHVLGLTAAEMGTARLERPVPGREMRERKTLLRPDELVMREAIRRRMCMPKKWVELLAYGLHDELGRPLPEPTEAELNAELMAMKL